MTTSFLIQGHCSTPQAGLPLLLRLGGQGGVYWPRSPRRIQSFNHRAHQQQQGPAAGTPSIKDSSVSGSFLHFILCRITVKDIFKKSRNKVKMFFLPYSIPYKPSKASFLNGTFIHSWKISLFCSRLLVLYLSPPCSDFLGFRYRYFCRTDTNFSLNCCFLWK